MSSAEYMRQLYAARKAAGVCVSCGARDAAPYRVKCPACQTRDTVMGAVRRSAKRREGRG